jgi:hypothetical protein
MIRISLAVLSLLAAACGGAVATSGGDGGTDGSTDGSGGHDSSADAPPSDTGQDAAKTWSPVCPEEPPAVGSPCSPTDGRDSPELLCEYGTPQYDPSCDTVLTCQSGTWQVAPTAPTKCQPDGPNPSSCPATWADVNGEAGVSCSVAGLRCEYPQGVCTCATSFGGPIEVDAGTRWFCDPPPGCPMPRPRLGASCSGPSTPCEYFPCSFAEECSGGYWQGLFEGCAKAGGSGG